MQLFRDPSGNHVHHQDCDQLGDIESRGKEGHGAIEFAQQNRVQQWNVHGQAGDQEGEQEWAIESIGREEIPHGEHIAPEVEHQPDIGPTIDRRLQVPLVGFVQPNEEANVGGQGEYRGHDADVRKVGQHEDGLAVEEVEQNEAIHPEDRVEGMELQ